MKTRLWLLALTTLSLLLSTSCQTGPTERVGPLGNGGQLMPTHQLLHPAGESVAFPGRPVDLVLAPDRRTLYVKDNRGLVVIDLGTWTVRQKLELKQGGSSPHGIAVTRNGAHVYLTAAQDALWEADVAADGTVSWGREILLPGPEGKGNSQAAGIALSSDETKAYVCLSRNNTLGIVDLRAGKLIQEIAVGVAPFDVALAADGRTGYVSNWGGRHPRHGEKTARSSGTDALVDDRGVAASGTVSIVDLEKNAEIAEVVTGLHPSALALSPDQTTLYVANANSDSVSVIDPVTQLARETIGVRPDPALPFGSAPNALCLSRDGNRLFAANGGNNAVAVVNVAADRPAKVEGFIPAAWYPGGLATDGRFLYVANVKGLGSRYPMPDRRGWNSRDYLGTVTRVEIPSATRLAEYSRQVRADARVPAILRALEKADRARERAPVPVPPRTGDPSVFEHVVYIIKENRTYDQVLGDLPRGNRDPSLCVFGREATPNHHALAEQFVLLDNYYCNGVLSADGHAWAMEGYATDYLEKSFGGFTRSYPFGGDDPLSYAAAGFIWDDVLAHGLSFRNYGEMSRTTISPATATFQQVYDDNRHHAGQIKFQHDIQIDTLRHYSCPSSPGWNLTIPDQVRADAFLAELKDFEREGYWPSLIIIFLPCDHTTGTSPGQPTPRAQIADNDLAVGRIVDAISHSRFWPKTCLFVIEDDPQAGFDHVDGHRSFCLVASPYTKRGAVVSRFYNQTSVLHTMERILGIPPMNQMDALAPVMTECFTAKPDFTPYACQPNQIPLDEMNRPLSQLPAAERHWAQASLALPFDEPDRADEDTLNRILWHSVKGVDSPYPAQWAGAHGRGLKALHLKLTPAAADDD